MSLFITFFVNKSSYNNSFSISGVIYILYNPIFQTNLYIALLGYLDNLFYTHDSLNPNLKCEPPAFYFLNQMPKNQTWSSDSRVCSTQAMEAEGYLIGSALQKRFFIPFPFYIIVTPYIWGLIPCPKWWSRNAFLTCLRFLSSFIYSLTLHEPAGDEIEVTLFYGSF